MPTIISPSFEETSNILEQMFRDPYWMYRTCAGHVEETEQELEYLSCFFDCSPEEIVPYIRRIQITEGQPNTGVISLRAYVADSVGQALVLIGVGRHVDPNDSAPSANYGQWIRLHHFKDMEEGHLNPAIDRFLKCDEATFSLTAFSWAINPAPAATFEFLIPEN